METSPYVDYEYTANTEFEDILFGEELRDGMIVLIEDHMSRQNMDSVRSRYDRDRADEMNRWCTVTRLQSLPSKDYSLVRFIGVYPDGSMRVRTYAASTAWIVKRESVMTEGDARPDAADSTAP